MKAGIDFARFTWDGGAAALGGLAGAAVTMADEAGFSTIAAMDHFFQIPMVGEYTEPMLDGYTFLGFAAGRSTRAKLQLMVTGVTYRHPGLLAKIVTTLDVLSGGRAILGIGAAWNDHEHLALGVPFPSTSERYERLDETLAICAQMWGDDNGPFHGTHYQLTETLSSPVNVSTPGPEIMVGGMGPNKTLKLAARHAGAVNWFPIGHDAVAGLKARLAQHCEAEGTDVDAIRLTLMTFPPPPGGLDGWLTDIEGYRALGFDEIYLAPASRDPRVDIETYATEVLPRVAAM